MSKNYNNIGQEDASKGKYERPHGEIEKLLETSKREKEMIKENQEYDKGWRHTKDQK